MKYFLYNKIGIECHIQIHSNSKLFSSSINEYGNLYNIFANDIDLGLPGTLPIVNEYVISSAIKLGHVINAKINNQSLFIRKHYFYPDLPKGYQITQYKEPIAEDGFIFIKNGKKNLKVDIERIQIEEDTGRIFHEHHYNYVNFNRSGIPLLEVVTNPSMQNAEEVIKFVKTLRNIITSLNISNGNMEEGSLRVDINISTQNKKNVIDNNKVEIKNINSIKFIGQAVNYEIQRQFNLKKRNLNINNETRYWNSRIQATSILRKKESISDYRYILEPNIPKIYLSNKYINQRKKYIFLFPQYKLRKIENLFSINDLTANLIINFDFLIFYILKIVKIYNKPILIINWILNYFFNILNTKNYKLVNPISIKPIDMGYLVKLVEKQIISRYKAKKIFFRCIFNNKKSLLFYLYKINPNFIKLSHINEVIDKHIILYSKKIHNFKNSFSKFLEFFIGKILKSLNYNISPSKLKNIVIYNLKFRYKK